MAVAPFVNPPTSFCDIGISSQCVYFCSCLTASRHVGGSRAYSYAFLQTEAMQGDIWKNLSLQKAMNCLEELQPNVEGILWLLQKCIDERNVEFALIFSLQLSHRIFELRCAKASIKLTIESDGGSHETPFFTVVPKQNSYKQFPLVLVSHHHRKKQKFSTPRSHIMN